MLRDEGYPLCPFIADFNGELTRPILLPSAGAAKLHSWILLADGIKEGHPSLFEHRVVCHELVRLIADGDAIEVRRVTIEDMPGQRLDRLDIAVFEAEAVDDLDIRRPGELEQLINVCLGDEEVWQIDGDAPQTQALDADGAEQANQRGVAGTEVMAAFPVGLEYGRFVAQSFGVGGNLTLAGLRINGDNHMNRRICESGRPCHSHSTTQKDRR